MVSVGWFKLGRGLENCQSVDLFPLDVIRNAKLVVGIHKIGAQPDGFFEMYNGSLILIYLAVERAKFILNFGRSRVNSGMSWPSRS